MPSLLVQECSQPPLLVLHSFTSEIDMNKHEQMTTDTSLPEQFIKLLSRVYPIVQEQLKFPTVFVQMCSHPPLPKRHSLTSLHAETDVIR